MRIDELARAIFRGVRSNGLVNRSASPCGVRGQRAMTGSVYQRSTGESYLISESLQKAAALMR